MTDWDVFFDLNPLRRYVRILTRESMSMAHLADRFHLTMTEDEEADPLKAIAQVDSEASTEPEIKNRNEDNSDEEAEGGGEAALLDRVQNKFDVLRSSGDVLFFDDSNLYDYRFSENPGALESIRTKSKFGQEFTIDWLAQRPERLIHLGSIFGAGRVVIDSLESRAWQLMIRDQMILNTDVLQSTSQRIADKISGTIEQDHEDKQIYGRPFYPVKAGFVGIHIRMSDGHFSLAARDTIENIRQELKWQMGITNDNEGQYHGSSSDTGPIHRKQSRLSIEQCHSKALDHQRSLQERLQRQQEQQQQQQHSFSHSQSTSMRRSNGRFTPIYLATDAHQPRLNPIFDRLFETFSCIFTLDDFSEDLEPLHQYRNPEDGTLMAKFLIPMVDAMVVAKSAAFFGTPASTFSNYIQKQLRPAYTGLYD
ncbi:hypothetical protein BGZ65_004230 [Modicella reniformis]|uniref:Uncharacterized protein n=1 Tax=Modicella reniformis TaxID=1440133 RepID=A0A9P6STA9_9FUNG|nr:hypothetical protein BGZ65_004230 [Modicella reniformis]